MSAGRVFFIVGLGLCVSTCGLYVPEIQENPLDSKDGQKFVEEVVENVTCEVSDAVADLYRRNPSTFLDAWGALITLTLTTEESGGVSPSVNWLPPSPAAAIFNLNAGATASSDATRIDILNSYYTVKQLRTRGPCNARSHGPFLLQSDLKLKEWLFDALKVGDDGVIEYPNGKNDTNLGQDVLSHEVKFEITTGANITPGWVLTRATVNQNGSLLTANRNRTHDLLITFGPVNPSTYQLSNAFVRGRWTQVQVPGPSAAAQNVHFASQIGLAISNNLAGSPHP